MNRRRIEKFKQYLSSEIIACFNCRPQSEGETIWFNPHTDLDDLLVDFDLSDDEWEIIFENLRCPNCDQPFETRCDQVEIKSEYDHSVEEILNKIENEKILDKLFEFNEFLSLYPYLGSLSKTGKQIFNLVKNGKTYSIESEDWYRARKFSNEHKIFSTDEMGAPDPLKAHINEGRYNHTGQSFLYLSNAERTAFLEIKQESETQCVVQKFKIKNLNNLLDLRFNYSNIDPSVDIIYWAIIYNGFINAKSYEKSSWKPEYFVPRFIADATRFHNYEGIIYSSAVSDADNLVIFNTKHESTEPTERPYIFKYNDVLNFSFLHKGLI